MQKPTPLKFMSFFVRTLGAMLLLAFPVSLSAAQGVFAGESVDAREPRRTSEPVRRVIVSEDRARATEPGEPTGVVIESVSGFGAERPWRFHLRGGAYRVSFASDVVMPGAGGTEFELVSVGADEPTVGFMAEAAFRKDKWTLFASGYHVDADFTQAATVPVTIGTLGLIPAGVNVRSEIAYTVGEFGAAYELPAAYASDEVLLVFDVYAGGRVYDLDMTYTRVGVGGVSYDNTWFTPMVGGGFELDLPHGFGVDLKTDFAGWSAGDQDVSSWNIVVAFTWEPTSNVAATVGFRHMSFDFTEDEGAAQEFTFDGWAAGLFAGATVRF